MLSWREDGLGWIETKRPDAVLDRLGDRYVTDSARHVLMSTDDLPAPTRHIPNESVTKKGGQSIRIGRLHHGGVQFFLTSTGPEPR